MPVNIERFYLRKYSGLLEWRTTGYASVQFFDSLDLAKKSALQSI